MFLVFNTYNQAYIANAIISQNMRLSRSITMAWAEISETTDGKFYIPKPNERFMDMVTEYTKMEIVENIKIE